MYDANERLTAKDLVEQLWVTDHYKVADWMSGHIVEPDDAAVRDEELADSWKVFIQAKNEWLPRSRLAKQEFIEDTSNKTGNLEVKAELENLQKEEKEKELLLRRERKEEEFRKFRKTWYVNQFITFPHKSAARTLMGSEHPISVLSERQPATSIYADGRSSDDVIAF